MVSEEHIGLGWDKIAAVVLRDGGGLVCRIHSKGALEKRTVEAFREPVAQERAGQNGEKDRTHERDVVAARIPVQAWLHDHHPRRCHFGFSGGEPRSLWGPQPEKPPRILRHHSHLADGRPLPPRPCGRRALGRRETACRRVGLDCRGGDFLRDSLPARGNKPALARGDVVLCDRFTDATFAYQGGGRGFDWQVLAQLERMVQALPDGALRQPELTVWFDLDPQIAAQRLASARVPDKFESQPADFFAAVRAGYAKRQAENPSRFARIDAAQSMDAVGADVGRVVTDWLKKVAA